MTTLKKVLWIGFGNFGKRLHQYVVKRPDVEVVSFYHPDKTLAKERFGSKACSDITAAVTDPSVTAVFITTPNDQHAEYLKLALNNKKHVFVEKPITASLKEALEIGPTIRKNSGVLMVGHNMRRRAAIREIKRIIDSGTIGKVVNIYANYSKGIAASMNPTSWRYKQKHHREGPLITVGIHLIDVFHYLMGPIASVSSTIKNISGWTEAPDSNATLFNFKNGATAFLETNYNTPSEAMLYVFGTEGALYLNGDVLSCHLGRDKEMVASKTQVVILDKIDDLEEEMDEFFEAIDGHGRVETGYQEAINALAVIESCYISSVECRLVKINNVTDKYFR